jgi:hypothetical protein
LQKNPLAFPADEDFMVSQPGISEDIGLPSSEPMLICIGHSPVSPLAASPLMGSAAQSKCPEKFHGWDYSDAILSVSANLPSASLTARSRATDS